MQQSLPREILRLAIPAFGALIAEPLFLLVDSAVVGHAGTNALAGLGVASGILLSLVGIFVFLAYGTTAIVSRKLGAGDRAGALTAGVDGIWLAATIGIVVALTGWFGAELFVNLFGASQESSEQAVIYLRFSSLGIPAMFIVLAATGALRGLQDTLTPLVASGIGFTVNAALSWLFVHPCGWGISGAAWATVIAQSGMAIGLLAVIIRGARHEKANLHFAPHGVLRAAIDGIPLLIRTLALRGVVLLTTWTASGLGDAPLAAHQVTMTIWSALAFAMDALAIAAQAITGRALGAGETDHTRTLTTILVRWGIGYGIGLGVVIALIHSFIPSAFTNDPEVITALSTALLVVAAGQPIAGVAFVLDGVLIGAGDARWLAKAQVIFLLCYLPMALAVQTSNVRGATGLVWLWVAFIGFMTVRAAGLWWRSRQDTWMITGA